MKTDLDVLAKYVIAFEEWEKNYRNSPEEYMSEIDRNNMQPLTFAELQAKYFALLLEKL